jgi:hypothetical protein
MKKVIAALVVCAGAAAAWAQPAATDLGTLTSGTPVTANPTLAASGDVVWYTFTIGEGTSNTIYLDMDTEGTLLAPGNDCEIGLFSSDGTLIVSDDDDGSGLMSAMSFGGGCVSRAGAAGGLSFDGRDGALAAGTYYLSFSGFNSTFANGWSVTTTSANLGAGVLNIRYGVGAAVEPGVFSEACAGEAGDLPATALAVDGQTGTLNTIRGTITASNADMYAIEICDFASFSATTVGGSSLDTQLFLFNPDGVGVTYNDDSSATLQSTLTSSFVSSNGRYLLAITGYNLDPADGSGSFLWLNTPFGVERIPDGPGAANPIAAWSGTSGSGAYSIALTGACFVGGGGPICNDIDFNNDGSFFDPTDVDAFFSVFSEGPCIPASATCDGIDFNNDGSLFDPCDVDAFLLVFSEGPCTLCGN